MAMDMSAVGFETPPYEFDYDWKTTVSYALSIGAKREELDYLYIGRGPKVYPTFPLIAAYVPMGVAFGRSGGNMPMEVHGGQSIRLFRPVPPQGKIVTVAKITGIYDRKKFAQVILHSRHTLGGEPLAEAEWSTIWRADGGFGGPPPPERKVPAVPRDRAPDWTFEDPIYPETALHYTTMGDVNPTHTDPDWARQMGFPQGPILHGLCTYGFVARAVIRSACGGDATRLIAFDAEFRKNVWPGATHARLEPRRRSRGRRGPRRRPSRSRRLQRLGRAPPVGSSHWIWNGYVITLAPPEAGKRSAVTTARMQGATPWRCKSAGASTRTRSTEPPRSMRKPTSTRPLSSGASPSASVMQRVIAPCAPRKTRSRSCCPSSRASFSP
jgi:acyl dehydratase